MSYIDTLLRAPKITEVNDTSKVMLDVNIPLKKNQKLSQCTFCLKKCSLDNQVYYYIRVYKNLQQIGYIKQEYDEVLKQDFVCFNCQHLYLIKCNVCDKLFHIDSTVNAWNNSDLTIRVNVCLTCFSNEACTSCHYLAGASPCRYCR
jgi:hypothetical protein